MYLIIKFNNWRWYLPSHPPLLQPMKECCKIFVLKEHPLQNRTKGKLVFFKQMTVYFKLPQYFSWVFERTLVWVVSYLISQVWRTPRKSVCSVAQPIFPGLPCSSSHHRLCKSERRGPRAIESNPPALASSVSMGSFVKVAPSGHGVCHDSIYYLDLFLR